MNDLRNLVHAPVTVPEETSLADAARKMEDNHVGALIVTRDNEPIGLVTDRDLALFAMLEGESDDTIAACTSSPLIGIGEKATVHEATSMLQRHGIRRLVVRDDDGAMVGVVSADDFFTAVGSQMGQLAKTIQREFLDEEFPTPPQARLGKE